MIHHYTPLRPSTKPHYYITACFISVWNPKKKKLFAPIWHWSTSCWDEHAFWSTMPPSYPGSPKPPDSCFTAPILARLLVYVPVGTAKKKGTRKETKTKELTHSFSATRSNYIQLLNVILEKHHISNKFHTCLWTSLVKSQECPDGLEWLDTTQWLSLSR